MSGKEDKFSDLVNLIAFLRSPEGCPWDRKQTHKSILNNLLEEAYEVFEAIEKNDYEKLKEELGDLLLQVIFQAQMASEKRKFDIDLIIQELIQKLKDRHPHVFKTKQKLSVQKVLHNWEKIKLAQNKDKKIMEGLPKSLPSLLRAYRAQEKIARLGFDWENCKQAYQKIEEELNELKHSFALKNNKKTEEELGDLLFALVSFARHKRLNPELALRKAIDKFIKRYQSLEKSLASQNRTLRDLTYKEILVYWHKTK